MMRRRTKYLLIAGSQSAHRHRQSIADCLKVPQDRVRAITRIPAAALARAPISIPNGS